MKAFTLTRIFQAQTPGYVFSKPTADSRFCFKQIIVAETNINVSIKLLRWTPTDNINRTTGGVTPVQSTLRPFQNLDTFHVKQRCTKTCGRRLKNTIYIYSYRRVGISIKIILSDTTNGHHRVTAGKGCLDIDIGVVAIKIGYIVQS